MRVVSLNCSNTEIVCALGCSEALVAVDTDSDYPADVVDALPRVGRDLQIDADAVAELRPDLVLASLTVPGHEHVVASIEERGLAMYAPETIRLLDVYEDVRNIADRLGVPERGEQLVREMDAAMPARGVADRAPRIFVEWWPKPAIGAGRSSWVHDLIERAGGVNALGDWEVKSSPVTDEAARAARIDDVVISWCGVPTAKYRTNVVLEREAWDEVPAVREGRVHPVAEAYLGRPGPRLVEGYRALCGIVDAAARER